MNGSGAHRATLLAVFAAILFASFSYDLFRVADREAYFSELTRHHYIGFDSYLVLDRLHLTERGEAGFLSPLTERYHSQFGLQGVLLGGILKATGVSAVRLAYLAAACFSLLTALLLAAFFTDIAKRLGPISASVGVLLTAWSPQLLYMAPSLYWCTFLLLAPFVAAWLLDGWLTRSTYGCWRRAAIIFVLVLAKCLCGYEYVTAVILSPLAAIWYHRAEQPRMLRAFLVQSTVVVGGGVTAFVVALLLHALQLQHVVGVDGFETIRERAVARTIADSGQEGTRIPIRRSFRRLPDGVAYTASCFVEYLHRPAVATPGFHPSVQRFVPLKYFFYFLLTAGIAVVAARRFLPKDSPRMIGAACVGAAASLSWHVLAINHMRVHFHLNGIIFFVPFLPLCFVAVGHAVESLLCRIQLQPRCAGLLAPALVALVVCGALLETNHRAVRYADYSSARSAVAAVIGQARQEGSAGWQYHIEGMRELSGFPSPECDFGSEMNRSRLVQERGIRGKLTAISGWVALPIGADAGRLQLLAVRDGDFVNSDVRYYPRLDAAKVVGPQREAKGFHLVIRSGASEDFTHVRVFACCEGQVQELALPSRVAANP